MDANGSYGAAALTEFGAIVGTVPLAGAMLNRTVSLAPGFADTAYGMSERYIGRFGFRTSIIDGADATLIPAFGGAKYAVGPYE